MSAATAALIDNRPVDTLRFPMSPEYCGDSWKLSDGLREIIANGLDEDIHARVEWKDGYLIVEDDGPGLPRKGLLLGISRDNRGGGRKRDDQVGRFGEGLNVGSLVIARSNCFMRVETVGYAFEPSIVCDPTLDAEVLQFTFFACDRTRGTKVMIECNKRTAEAAIARFRHLQPGYKPVQAPGAVLADGPAGRVFLGGLLVQERKDLAFSYDIALDAETKAMQNRDRSVIDGYRLEHAIHRCLSATTDEQVLEKWVRKALKGKLGRAERRFNASPQQKRIIRKVGKRVLDADKVMWVAAGNEELALDLKDRGYTVIEQNGDRWEHAHLMDLLGIQEAKQKAKRVAQHNKAKTTWTQGELDDDEQAVLDRAMRLGRIAWGADCFGAKGVRIFEEHTPEAGDYGDGRGWIGFYSPRTDQIAIKRSVLADGLRATLEVLLHETAHRLQYKRHRYEWEDRTRGFERMLGDLGAAALQVMAKVIDGEIDLDTVDDQDTAAGAADQGPWADAAALIRERMQAKGITTAKQLAFESGLSYTMCCQLLGGARNGAPYAKYLRALEDLLGIRWQVLYAGLDSANVAKRTRRKDGRLYGSSYTTLVQVADDLAAMGEPYAQHARTLRAHAEGVDRSLPFAYKGQSPDKLLGWRDFPRPDSPWLAPYAALVAAERERLAAQD